MFLNLISSPHHWAPTVVKLNDGFISLNLANDGFSRDAPGAALAFASLVFLSASLRRKRRDQAQATVASLVSERPKRSLHEY